MCDHTKCKNTLCSNIDINESSWDACSKCPLDYMCNINQISSPNCNPICEKSSCTELGSIKNILNECTNCDISVNKTYKCHNKSDEYNCIKKKYISSLQDIDNLTKNLDTFSNYTCPVNNNTQETTNNPQDSETQ